MLKATKLQRLTLGPVDLSLAEGEIVALRGVSGSGKTLLMRALADLDPCQGQVWLGGVERETFSGPDWRRLVAWVPAEAGWWAEQVRHHFVDWTAALNLIAELGLPPECGDWPLVRASTGERQRLALVRAIVQKPRVLLLDEPTSGLDKQAVGLVENLIAGLAASGSAVLWTTHDDIQAARVADRMVQLENGALSEVPGS